MTFGANIITKNREFATNWMAYIDCKEFEIEYHKEMDEFKEPILSQKRDQFSIPEKEYAIIKRGKESVMIQIHHGFINLEQRSEYCDSAIILMPIGKSQELMNNLNKKISDAYASFCLNEGNSPTRNKSSL